MFFEKGSETVLYVRSRYERAEELQKLLVVLKEMDGIGVELMPLWEQEAFGNFLEAQKEFLKRIPIAFCGAEGKTEFSESLGSKDDIRSLSYMKKTLEMGKVFGVRHIVFHYNHCTIVPEEKSWHIENAKRNLQFINYMNRQYRIPILLENAGTESQGDGLFTEKEFTEECKYAKNLVLLDVKNAAENGWNLERLIPALKDDIAAYRLYKANEPQREMFDEMDIEKFRSLYQRYTPKADIILECGKTELEDQPKLQKTIAYLQEVLFRESRKNKCLKKQAV